MAVELEVKVEKMGSLINFLIVMQGLNLILLLCAVYFAAQGVGVAEIAAEQAAKAAAAAGFCAPL